MAELSQAQILERMILTPKVVEALSSAGLAADASNAVLMLRWLVIFLAAPRPSATFIDIQEHLIGSGPVLIPRTREALADLHTLEQAAIYAHSRLLLESVKKLFAGSLARERLWNEFIVMDSRLDLRWRELKVSDRQEFELLAFHADRVLRASTGTLLADAETETAAAAAKRVSPDGDSQGGFMGVMKKVALPLGVMATLWGLFRG